MSKYGNKKTILDGIEYDSAKEARRAAELQLMQRAGVIRELRRQVSYELIPAQRDKTTGKIVERAVTYKADFVYVYAATGETIAEDAKGFRTKDYIIKRKLMLYRHGIRIREI